MISDFQWFTPLQRPTFIVLKGFIKAQPWCKEKGEVDFLLKNLIVRHLDFAFSLNIFQKNVSPSRIEELGTRAFWQALLDPCFGIRQYAFFSVMKTFI